MDPFLLIKALSISTLIIVGAALLVFWRTSDREPFLLYWAIYEFALAVALLVDNNVLLSSTAVGIAVPTLLLGVLKYRQKELPSRSIYCLLFLAITLPAFTLGHFFDKIYGVIYLAGSFTVAYLATAVLFMKERGSLNTFIAVIFLGRTANVLVYPVFETQGLLYINYWLSQVCALAAGVGMLMAGFAKAYSQLQTRERQLLAAYKQSEELTQRLERRSEEYSLARQTAEAANAAKTRFLANMSHELRTPLNAIIGFSQMLALLPKQQVVEKVDEYAHHIQGAAHGLQTIIDDVLDLSRVEAGALDLKYEDCDLSEVVGDVVCLLQPLADQREITISYQSSAPSPLRCDIRLTRQAAINGISNAIKYTQRGGTVICRVGNDNGYAVISVEDNGMGIAEESLTNAFNPFWQEGDPHVAENGGVGLGLTIARSYIEAQGGRVELKRAGERGTIFRISLPIAENAVTAAPKAVSARS